MAELERGSSPHSRAGRSVVRGKPADIQAVASPLKYGSRETGVINSWRGTVGDIRPNYRPGGLEEFIRLLPPGISVIPVSVGIKSGTEEEFQQVLQSYKDRVGELAGLGVDLIYIAGAPPMMVHGLRGEEEIVNGLEQKHHVSITTAGQGQIAALRALGVKRFVGVTYFNDSLNQIFHRYFEEAGFDVAAMEGINVRFSDVGRLSAGDIYAHTKRAFLKHKDADAIYMLGSGWRVLDVAPILEQDLQVPVVYALAAKIWQVQKRLRVRQPVKGYGRLLGELP